MRVSGRCGRHGARRRFRSAHHPSFRPPAPGMASLRIGRSPHLPSMRPMPPLPRRTSGRESEKGVPRDTLSVFRRIRRAPRLRARRPYRSVARIVAGVRPAGASCMGLADSRRFSRKAVHPPETCIRPVEIVRIHADRGLIRKRSLISTGCRFGRIRGIPGMENAGDAVPEPACGREAGPSADRLPPSGAAGAYAHSISVQSMTSSFPLWVVPQSRLGTGPGRRIRCRTHASFRGRSAPFHEADVFSGMPPPGRENGKGPARRFRRTGPFVRTAASPRCGVS